MNSKPKLREGDPAPEFEAADQSGNIVRLSDYRGKPVVLYFYPKDDTPGCTKEACGFRDAYRALQKAGAVVLGISTDSVQSHSKFANKFQLPFPLVADEEKNIVHSYGVWGEKTFMGRKFIGTHRMTFLIDSEGCVKRIWGKVKPETHAQEVLKELQS